MFWKRSSSLPKEAESNNNSKTNNQQEETTNKNKSTTNQTNTKSNLSENLLDKYLSCDHYEYEFKSNCGVLGKINRFLRSDEPLYDCNYYQDLLLSCLKYKVDPEVNLESLVKLKKYENELVKRRIESIKQNDVWKAREEPPSDWNAPLPDWCQERIKDSYWYKSSKSSNKSSN